MTDKELKNCTFILASASPRRRDLLRQIGIDPVISPADADETVPDGLTDPKEIVRLLAKRKADAAEKTQRGPAILLAADTVVALNETIFGKPGTEEEAFQMLKALSGRKHTVCTGIALRAYSEEGRLLNAADDVCATDVYVAGLSDGEILSYIESGEPFDKAGGYAIQGLFARHIERIDGDYSNVVGLPLALVYRHLKDLSAGV